MPSISRREFLKTAAADSAMAGFLAAAAGTGARANPLGLPIGCQTWPVRTLIAQDFAGTLKQLAEIGFQTIELCSPAGYASSGFGGIAKYSGADLRKMLGDFGLKCESSHFGIQELRDDLQDRIAWAKDVGLTQMIIPTFGGSKAPTMDDVKRVADEYNRMAEQSARAGIQQGLHNEVFESATVDGKRVYDLLLQLLDPKLVKFQFQVSTLRDGFDPVEYFNKYPGRFMSMHVQDWSAADKKQMVPVGQGAVDWKRIFAAAQTGGVKNYFVEMNLDLMKASVPYLRNLQV
jgi:sugar phosphate isomerase/epimerase